jgi:hypothetical protein
MNASFHQFRNKIINPVQFRFFLLVKLPTAFLCGLRIKQFSEKSTTIVVRHWWFTQNPFRSMYFAVQSMAAEMSTGLMCFGQIYQREPAVSMLVVRVDSQYIKKATGLIFFTCEDGEKIEAAIEETIRTGEGTGVVTRSVGTNEKNEIVAEFQITWSFKAKKSNP